MSEPNPFPNLVKKKSQARSRVTNGKDVLPGIDGRSPTARRYRDIAVAICIDQGGEDRLSEARVQLIRRFSAAACMAEKLEARLVEGGAIDINEHATLCSTMVRIASRIGIDRRARNVSTLKDYLDDVAAEEPSDVDAAADDLIDAGAS
jgi:hypothetical protein